MRLRLAERFGRMLCEESRPRPKDNDDDDDDDEYSYEHII